MGQQLVPLHVKVPMLRSPVQVAPLAAQVTFEVQVLAGGAVPLPEVLALMNMLAIRALPNIGAERATDSPIRTIRRTKQLFLFI
jgi:hypothetical protein